MAANAGWQNTVSPTYWNDQKVRAWHEDGRALALYLLTCPSATGEGFYHLPLGLAAEDLQWPSERLQDALDELVATDFADYDEGPRVVLVVKGLKYHESMTNPRKWGGALTVLNQVQGSPRLFERFLAAADRYQPVFAARIRERYRL